jgi:hypothetical protein
MTDRFRSLRPGDELMVLSASKPPRCIRAKVVDWKGDLVRIALWNSAVQRWNNPTGQMTIGEDRVAEYLGVHRELSV